MKFEGGAGSHLLGPVLQAARYRQLQLPQHSFEPHGANQHPHQPGSKMRAGALGSVLPPVADRNEDTRHQQISPATKLEMVACRAGQELPDVSQRILWHKCCPSARKAVLKVDMTP